MTTYRPASAVARIADKLIPKHHAELGDDDDGDGDDNELFDGVS